jgi:hypothetical protein
MEQRFLFTASETERQPDGMSDGQSQTLTMSSPETVALSAIPAEPYRQTEIYRLPDHFPVQALSNYEGAMIMVSHIPDFVSQVRIDQRIDLSEI